MREVLLTFTAVYSVACTLTGHWWAPDPTSTSALFSACVRVRAIASHVSRPVPTFILAYMCSVGTFQMNVFLTWMCSLFHLNLFVFSTWILIHDTNSLIAPFIDRLLFVGFPKWKSIPFSEFFVRSRCLFVNFLHYNLWNGWH